MINLKNIKPGTLLKVVNTPNLIVPGVGDLLSIDQNINQKSFKGRTVLVLDYKEGETIFTGFNNTKTASVFCVRILIIMDDRKYWIVLNINSNKDVQDLPDDLKEGFRTTNMFEIVDLDSND